MDTSESAALIPTPLLARFSAGVGDAEELTFPVRANLGAVVKFERMALEPGWALSTPTEGSWRSLRRACEFVGANQWDLEYPDPDPTTTDPFTWLIEIEWPDLRIRSSGRRTSPALAPGSPDGAALDVVCRALSRLADNRSVFGQRAVRKRSLRSPTQGVSVVDAVRHAATRLRQDDRRLEARLDSALAEGINRQADVEAMRGAAELPGWENVKSTMREIDVLVAGTALEQKVDDIGSQLWNAIKLASMLRDGRTVRAAYLVAWASQKRFARAPGNDLFRSAGIWNIADLVARNQKAWQKDTRNGSNAPLHTPARLRATRLVAADAGDDREIRLIRLELVDDQELRWADGMPAPAPPPEPRAITLTPDDLVEAWLDTLAPHATWWHFARHEAYTVVSGLDLRSAPSALAGPPPAWFDVARWAETVGRPLFRSGRSGELPALLWDVGRHVASRGKPLSGTIESTPEAAVFVEHFNRDITEAESRTGTIYRQHLHDLAATIHGPISSVSTTTRALEENGFDPGFPEPDTSD